MTKQGLVKDNTWFDQMLWSLEGETEMHRLLRVCDRENSSWAPVEDKGSDLVKEKQRMTPIEQKWAVNSERWLGCQAPQDKTEIVKAAKDIRFENGWRCKGWLPFIYSSAQEYSCLGYLFS